MINILFQRVAGKFAMALGALGVAACVAGAYPIWLTGSRLTGANEKIFTLLDNGLATTQEQTLNVQSRLRESRITASELAQGVRDWSIRQAEERLVTQLEVERRSD